MRKLARLAVAALAVGAVLVSVAPAPAGHAVRASVRQGGTTPELVVLPFDSHLNRVNADTGFAFVFLQSQPAAAKIVTYAPAGYVLDLAIPAGTTIGEADAAVAAGGATAVAWGGDIVVDSPAKYTTDPAATACAGAAPHAAVWLLQLKSGATTVPVAVFVDPTSGTEAALGVYKLQFCLPSTEVPGAPFGGRIVDLFVEFTRGVTNPNTSGAFLWREYETPYTAGTATPNDPATVEVRSIVLLPQTLTLKGRYDRKTKSIVLTGTLTLAGQRYANIDVVIYGSTKPADRSFKRLGAVKTKKKGDFSFKRKTKQTMYFGALVDEYFTGPRCETGPSSAPLGCIQENVSLETFSNRATVKVPKKKRS
jgi:hypothetical protein